MEVPMDPMTSPLESIQFHDPIGKYYHFTDDNSSSFSEEDAKLIFTSKAKPPPDPIEPVNAERKSDEHSVSIILVNSRTERIKQFFAKIFSFPHSKRSKEEKSHAAKKITLDFDRSLVAVHCKISENQSATFEGSIHYRKEAYTTFSSSSYDECSPDEQAKWARIDLEGKKIAANSALGFVHFLDQREDLSEKIKGLILSNSQQEFFNRALWPLQEKLTAKNDPIKQKIKEMSGLGDSLMLTGNLDKFEITHDFVNQVTTSIVTMIAKAPGDIREFALPIHFLLDWKTEEYDYKILWI